MRLFALVLAINSIPALLWTATAQTPAPSVGSSPANVSGAILVELFTSEGCSSCPPADELLRQVSGRTTAAGQLIVGLSEHVAYWDRLGWKDAFSDPVFTSRQNDYGNRFRLDSVYTPQMIVNGERQFVGGDSKALTEALNAAEPKGRIDLRIVSAQTDINGLTVQFSAERVPNGANLDLMAAIADDLDETHVLRGENGGRTLTHTSVARTLQRIAQIHGNTTQIIRIALPPALIQSPEKPRHVVIFAQQRNVGTVVGVTTKPIAIADKISAGRLDSSKENSATAAIVR